MHERLDAERDRVAQHPDAGAAGDRVSQDVREPSVDPARGDIARRVEVLARARALLKSLRARCPAKGAKSQHENVGT
jgi:hypothetical protein